MRMLELIVKKRDGQHLTKEELSFWIDGYVKGEIPDYQVSALLMAIYYQGMSDEELGNLTMLMARSGDMADLSPIQGCKVDKHSTGGVGDKTTLIIGPMVAACGVKVAGQSGNLVPADKKLYALRDVTGTVESIPLIASSIMSKKLASGSDAILLDVKTGSGAFMKNLEDAVALAKKMTAIGRHVGRKVSAMITNMDEPLGNAIGNTLEVIEAIETLNGHGPKDLTELCIDLAAEMLVLAEKGTRDECRELAKDSLYSGKALKKWKEMVAAQGGDPDLIDYPQRFQKASAEKTVTAPQEGYISHMDAEGCGITASLLGAGREKKEDSIDYTAGIVLSAKCGDFVKKGDPIATLYTSDPKRIAEAEKKLLDSLTFSANPPEKLPMVYQWITY